MGSEIRSHEDISKLCDWVLLPATWNFNKRKFRNENFSRTRTTYEKSGPEQITVEEEAFTQHSKRFFANYIGTIATILFRVYEWGLNVSSCFSDGVKGGVICLRIGFTFTWRRCLSFSKQMLAQAESRRKYPEHTWWVHIWAIETNSQDLLAQIKEYKHSAPMPHPSAVLHANKLYMKCWRQTLTLSLWLWPGFAV